MGDLILWLQCHFHDHRLLYFVALYIGGGRPVAIVTARLFGLNLLWFFPLVVLMDTLQVPCFYYLYEHTFPSGRLGRLSNYFQRKGALARGRRFFQTLRALGQVGVVLLTMLPIKGGGMWSGVFLAHVMGLRKRISFPLLVGGSVFGSLLFVGLGDSLIRLWHLIT
ncbi:MAG: small multi-drug export protein [Deltaproteobacteria bacterium]|nr:small multi-drug export protein [Deltaproteobacteria bacterium]MBW1793828.1 small multi-drug export protein [Deltaproteobacteria bacterium]MBW2329656.1 small multi-drug export protein [Deltaproteobacteria bacterium]